MKHETVKVNCFWELSRINIVFRNKELSLDLNISDSVELLEQLTKAVEEFNLYQRNCDKYFED